LKKQRFHHGATFFHRHPPVHWMVDSTIVDLILLSFT
jgi:hypothetical protein